MKNKKESLIIIPAHNESINLKRVIEKTKKYISSEADIIVVDDGSMDNTAKIARNCEVGVISLPFNMGYGAALQTGYKYAWRKGYKYVLQMDADGQHEPKCLIDSLSAIKENKADIVIGSRFLSNSNYRASFCRRLGMIIFGRIASIITGNRVTDPTSGFQALNRRVLRLFISEFYPSDYPDADVIINLHFVGFRIKEIPVVMYPALNNGKIHNGIKPLYYIFKMFLSISMIFLRKKYKIKK